MSEFDLDEEFRDFEEYEEGEDEEFDEFLKLKDEEFDGFLEPGDMVFDELEELDLGLEVAFDEAFRVFIEESAQATEEYMEELKRFLKDAPPGDEPSDAGDVPSV